MALPCPDPTQVGPRDDHGGCRQVLTTGYSRELPGPGSGTHAEECALRKAGDTAEGCDVYCTMEPCSKRASSPIVRRPACLINAQWPPRPYSRVTSGAPNRLRARPPDPCPARWQGCCMRIIQHKCRRVFIGAMEPAHFVVCEGVRIMQEAGVDVVRLTARA